MAGLSSAIGILLGGAPVEGPGWRWVMFVNPIACAMLVPAIRAVIPADQPGASRKRFDVTGAMLVTSGMLLLVFALVKAPTQGWGATVTWLEIAGAGTLLTAFLFTERRVAEPVLPLGIFRIRGLLAANFTGLVGFAAMLTMFFFLTLYMQTVLGYSPFVAGAAYLPLTFGVGISAGVGAKLLTKVGSRPVICVGALIASGGLLALSRVPVHGTYLANILPGTMLVAAGVGPVSAPAAATAGFRLALPAGAAFTAAAALISLRTANTNHDPMEHR